jgi:dipeptide/tripeptide permease
VTEPVEPKGNIMSATTVFGQVRSDQASAHSKRNAVIALTVIALFALSFFVGRETASTHASSTAQVTTTEQLSPANRALIANDAAPVTQQLSQANTASCVAGRPC